MDNAVSRTQRSVAIRESGTAPVICSDTIEVTPQVVLNVVLLSSRRTNTAATDMETCNKSIRTNGRTGAPRPDMSFQGLSGSRCISAGIIRTTFPSLRACTLSLTQYVSV